MARGRKSAASVEVTPMLPGSGRPEPPASLSAAEARCWHDVIDALPGFWVDGAGQLILRRVAIQTAFMEHLEAQIREQLASEAPDDAKLATLMGMHTQTAKAATFLLNQLRATPKARIMPRAANFEPSARQPEARPWEIRADPGDVIQ
jgi:hypothetical protein